MFFVPSNLGSMIRKTRRTEVDGVIQEYLSNKNSPFFEDGITGKTNIMYCPVVTQRMSTMNVFIHVNFCWFVLEVMVSRPCQRIVLDVGLTCCTFEVCDFFWALKSPLDRRTDRKHLFVFFA